ncbi:MAG: Flp family type IVb pilin [Mesorhizobium sp.]
MTLIAKLGGRLAKEEDGAALVEYTVLLGILVVAVIATIIVIGGWVSGQWGSLQDNLCEQDPAPAGCPAG